MSLSHGSGIVLNGLIFAYDMENTRKSFVGGPTTNYAYFQNPRIDDSYESWQYTTDTTWLSNHSNAIVVYNDAGGGITGYVNTGVNSGNWQVAHHAHWQYDEILKRPVVVQNDFDGQWKAKSFQLGLSFDSIGIGYDDQYTISWLQWTTDIAKSANAGLYGQNTSGTNGFWDGLSNSIPTSFNTLTRTWQRVYATFTINSTRNLSANLNAYMYGHYIKRGIIKIADVQIEPLPYPTGFSKEQNRTSSECLFDMVGGNSVTLGTLEYDSYNTFKFDGASENPITIPDSTLLNPDYVTIDVWVKFDTVANNKCLVGKRTATSLGSYWLFIDSSNNLMFDTYQNSVQDRITVNHGFQTGVWYNIVATYGNTFKKVYANGVEIYSGAGGNTLISNSANLVIGDCPLSDYQVDGELPIVKIYNRYLDAPEVQQNFNAIKSRYGL